MRVGVQSVDRQRGKRTVSRRDAGKSIGGKGRGAGGGRAGAVAHLRGPLVGVQGEFLERAGERRAPLARGLHIGIRGGEPPVRVGGAFVSRRDGHVVRDRTRAASDFGRRVRARTSAGFGWVGGRVSVLSRGGARVAGTRRALASRERRRGRATRARRIAFPRERDGSARTVRRTGETRAVACRPPLGRARAIRTRAFLFDAPIEQPRRW